MSNNAASNVIPMREFDRSTPAPQAAQFERLMKECQDLARERISKSVSTMLDKAEEALWGLAERSPDREQRDVYFTAKDKLRDQRRSVEEHFRAGLVSEFDNRVKRKDRADFSQYNLSSLELGLVENEDLEETIKINDMAGRLRRYCDEELVALDQRVGVLLGDATLQGERNPFSPHALCSAFRQACRAIEPSLKIRVIFLKLFDDHVLDDIRSIYKDLNALLVQRSILPKIRYSVLRSAGGAIARAGLPGTHPAGATAAAIAPEIAVLGGGGASGVGASFVDGAGYGAEYGGGEQDFFAVLQSLLARGPGTLGGAAGAGVARGVGPTAPGWAAQGGASAPGGSVTEVAGFPPIFGATPEGTPLRLLQGAELVGSLTRIQHGDISSIATGNLPLAATLVEPGTTNVLRELKTTSLGSGLGQMDGMTLDIVAMLFDQIFDDRKMPDAMKGLLGRLQIPMLKVAILDKNFFSKRGHPARRFLDALGEFALGLPIEFGSGSPLYKAVEGVIQKLIDEFKDSVDIFDALHTDLQRLAAAENARAEAEAQRVAKAIEQKERLDLATAVAQNEIKQRADAHRMPPVVVRFLASQWMKLLIVAHARFGKDSDAWKTAVETMDLLVWSVNSKQSLEERRKLAGVLPRLLRRLNAGMQGLRVDEETRKRFFAKLMRCHTKVMNGTMGAARPTPPQPQDAAAAPEIPTLDDAQPSGEETRTFVTDDPATMLGLAPRTTALLDLTHLAATAVASEGEATEASPELQERAAQEFDDDTEPTAAVPEFTGVTMKNPFGEGEIEVEEISLSDFPTADSSAPLTDEGADTPRSGDDYSRDASSLREGQWVEFRDEDDVRRPARLSYISPLKGTYLFVNRQGRKVGEYSVYQLARELRMGRAAIMEDVPLFDRAMSSLVGVLRKTRTEH